MQPLPQLAWIVIISNPDINQYLKPNFSRTRYENPVIPSLALRRSQSRCRNWNGVRSLLINRFNPYRCTGRSRRLPTAKLKIFFPSILASDFWLLFPTFNQFPFKTGHFLLIFAHFERSEIRHSFSEGGLPLDFWLLTPGFWLLTSGSWLLASEFWLLFPIFYFTSNN